MKSAGGYVAKFVVFDLLGSIVLFPIWWYTTGFADVFRWTVQSLRYRIKGYGFGIWMRNFFVPMYGQGDIAGRLISVAMRVVVLIGRAVAVVAEGLVYGLACLFWLAVPVLIAILLAVNISARFSI